MDYKLILLNCFIAVCTNAAHIPEVYETPQKSEGYNPTVFNFQDYKKATQQDPQRIRYQQQQLAPKVQTRKERVLNESSYGQDFIIPETAVKTSVWKMVHPKFVTENHREVPKFVTENQRQETKDQENPAKSMIEKQIQVPIATKLPETDKVVEIAKIPMSTNSTKNLIKDVVKPTDKPRIFKKSLLPNSYLVTENMEVSDRRDTNIGPHNFLFVNPAEVDLGLRQPKVVQQNLGGFVVANPPDNHLRALNSLIGKAPNAQLQGLQQLLQGNKLRSNKDHTPIEEHVVDVPNTQMKPNIKVEHATENPLTKAIKAITTNGNNDPVALKKLQAQLDATANANAEDIIAKAQQKAIAHVKAQHEAIARAQARAEQEALAQIQAQNQAIAAQAAEEESRVHTERAQQEKRRRKQERAQKIKQQQAERAKVVANQDAAVVAQKTRLKTKKTHNIQTEETQNHYYTHQLPVSHDIHHQQQHEQNQQHEQQHHFDSYKQEAIEADVSKFYNTPQTVPQRGRHEHDGHEHDEHDLQYAAKYSFGYRIRDFDHGNDFGHAESSEGETTKGHYHVLLPDGRIQNVDYYVDPSGYHATVSYGSSEQHGGH